MAERRPTVFLIHAETDAVWRDRVREALNFEAAIEIRSIEELRMEEVWEREARRSDGVLVLVSQDLLKSIEFIGGLPHFERITWVLVADAPWRTSPFVSIQAAIPPDKPLAAMNERELHDALSAL